MRRPSEPPPNRDEDRAARREKEAADQNPRQLTIGHRFRHRFPLQRGMEEPGGLGDLRRRWEHLALWPDQGAARALPAVPALSQDRNPELVGVNEPVEAHYVGLEGA